MAGKLVAPPTSREVAAFLEQLRAVPAVGGAGRGRLMFALDATASREPTWDRAAEVQGAMFEVAERLGGLDVQLVYYRGHGECRASRWVARPGQLVGLMTGVMCRAGQTQIARVLRHAVRTTRQRRVNALVFVGDCCEEDVDELGRLAGELAICGVRAFMFGEGDDPKARQAFAQVAALTGGAHCRFDAGSPNELRQLLGAVAAYAAGGTQALRAIGEQGGPAVRLLTGQVR